MDKLATTLRTAFLVTQNLHNLAKGISVTADHELLGEFYLEMLSNYDELVERCIGLGEEIDLCQLQVDAAQMAYKYDGSDMHIDEMFAVVLGFEREIQSKATEANKSATLGSQDLLQKIASASESRVYHLRQRIKG